MTDRQQADADRMWMEGSQARDAIRMMTAAQRERVRNQTSSTMWTFLPGVCLVLIVNRFNMPFFVNEAGEDVNQPLFLKHEAGVSDGE